MRVGWGLHSSPQSPLSLLQSSTVRDQAPTFIWTSQYNYGLLQWDQAVNHGTGIGSCTTKVRAWRRRGRGAVVPKSPLVPKPRGRTSHLHGLEQHRLNRLLQGNCAPPSLALPPQPSPLLWWAQVALPQCGARAPAPPATGHHHPYLHAPGSRAVLRAGGGTAPGGTQQSCDAKGHEGGGSILPTLSGATQRQHFPLISTRTRHCTGTPIPPTMVGAMKPSFETP